MTSTEKPKITDRITSMTTTDLEGAYKSLHEGNSVTAEEVRDWMAGKAESYKPGYTQSRKDVVNAKIDKYEQDGISFGEFLSVFDKLENTMGQDRKLSPDHIEAVISSIKKYTGLDEEADAIDISADNLTKFYANNYYTKNVAEGSTIQYTDAQKEQISDVIKDYPSPDTDTDTGMEALIEEIIKFDKNKNPNKSGTVHEISTADLNDFYAYVEDNNNITAYNPEQKAKILETIRKMRDDFPKVKDTSVDKSQLVAALLPHDSNKTFDFLDDEETTSKLGDLMNNNTKLARDTVKTWVDALANDSGLSAKQEDDIKGLLNYIDNNKVGKTEFARLHSDIKGIILEAEG